jgi:carboxypeptidase C (cathepsin A)
MKFSLRILIPLATLVSFNFAFADLKDGTCGDSEKATVTTEHTVKIRSLNLNYKATVGYLEVTAADQKSKACIFYTAYAVQNTAAPRPITFAFNGGPGSASLWLHMGALGPKRVDMGPEGLGGVASANVIDNDSSPLDVTDIVMIDPVATGFSHVEGDAKNEAFFGARNDYASVAAFIQNYLNANNRWTSPKFVMGESYGGIRGSLLAHHLQSDYGIGLAGVILVSPALSWTTLDFSAADNNVPYWSFFPNFATTAWYHKKIAAKYQSMSVADVYTAAKKFADTALRDALDQGENLDQATFDSVAQAVADFSGLSKSKVEELNLRIQDTDFFVGLLEDQRQTIGRFDARYVGQNPTPIRSPADIVDPSDSASGAPFTTAINQYLHLDLQLPIVSPYATVTNVSQWPFDSDGTTFNVLGDLSRALADNPTLRVFIASGYFDLACPMGTVEYELSQLPGGQSIRSRISQTKYFGGHMMYINPSALKALKDDLATFIGQQSRPQITLN